MTNTSIILGYMQLNNLDPNKIVLHTYICTMEETRVSSKERRKIKA
jgi:hypothetical protein